MVGEADGVASAPMEKSATASVTKIRWAGISTIQDSGGKEGKEARNRVPPSRDSHVRAYGCPTRARQRGCSMSQNTTPASYPPSMQSRFRVVLAPKAFGPSL